MLDSLIYFDQQAFHYLNHEWRNGFFDVVLPIWRNPLTWVPLYFVLYYAFWKKMGRKAFSYLLIIALTVAVSDQVSSQLIKKNVQRLRPCNDMSLSERPIQLIACGNGYSFTSSHAANHTAIAVIVLCLWNEKWNPKHVFLLLWATLVGYAQIYVGVHYPLDIVGGMLVGAMIARIIYAFCRNVFSMTN